jgi:hypothetical protein
VQDPRVGASLTDEDLETAFDETAGLTQSGSGRTLRPRATRTTSSRAGFQRRSSLQRGRKRCGGKVLDRFLRQVVRQLPDPLALEPLACSGKEERFGPDSASPRDADDLVPSGFSEEVVAPEGEEKTCRLVEPISKSAR